MPETKDTDWDWNDFLQRNNDELVATWGNLANRVLSFAYKNFEGKVPEPGELTALDRELLRRSKLVSRRWRRNSKRCTCGRPGGGHAPGD